MKWPQGWREVRVVDALYRVTDKFNPSRAITDHFYVGLEHIESHSGRLLKDEIATDVDDLLSTKTRFKAGDVLFGKLRPNLNKVYLASVEGICSTDIWALRPREFVLSEYAALYLRSEVFNRAVTRLAVGANLPRVPADAFDRLPFLLPPLPEQQRIVKVLQAADALRQAKHHVLQGFDDVVQARYRAQFGRYISRQGLLNPTRIGEHVESAQYGVSEAMAETGSHAVLRMNSITSSGWLDLSDLRYAGLSSQDAAATTLQDGDLLFNRTNSRELVGKCAIWRDVPGRYSFASYLVRLRLKPTLLPEYLWATLNSPYGKYRLFNAAKQAVSMANVSPTDLARISIPLPPIEEQGQFVAFVREVERQRGQIIVSGARMQTLQPALITEALSGRLTAAWREQHAQALAEAARERDARLGAPAPQVTVRITEHAPAERHTDLARPRRRALIEQLSSFQHEVWNTLRFEWRGAVLADDPAAFEEFCTSPQTAWRLEGFAAGREEVRRALEQLAAMGLIRKMSLPRPDPNTRRTEYLTAFRPLCEAEDGSRPEEDTALADAERLARELERRRAPEAR
ncbi:TPA: restriction endonuclease subunit S [Pseudomonas aeruginosa]|nr:restriction endonuclease subunit S [Pseudomonas aeruginosa]